MIRLLKGILENYGDDWLIIDVQGVGYEVFCHNRMLSQLPAIGESLKLHIITHVREDHIHLFGFVSYQERQWFEILQKVQGVGAKMAMTILSALPPESISDAIISGDKKLLMQANGVGAKVAGRIISELQDFILKNSDMAAITASPSSGDKTSVNQSSSAQDGAIQALEVLGYSRGEAFNAVKKIINDGEVDSEDTSALIQASLRYIGQNL